MRNHEQRITFHCHSSPAQLFGIILLLPAKRFWLSQHFAPETKAFFRFKQYDQASCIIIYILYPSTRCQFFEMSGEIGEMLDAVGVLMIPLHEAWSYCLNLNKAWVSRSKRCDNVFGWKKKNYSKELLCHNIFIPPSFLERMVVKVQSLKFS